MSALHAWALFGALAGLGLPLLIHFLTRPRGERRALPGFRFLLESANQSGRRNRLRAVLILTARMLALVLLALGFARFADRGLSGGATQLKRKVIVLDCSMSMRAVADNVSMFDRARARVQRALEAGDVKEADLIVAAHRARAVFGKTSSNLAALRSEAGQARATTQALNATLAIETAARSLAGLSEDDLKECEVVIVSDLQRGNWTKAVFSKLPRNVPVKLLSVRGEEPLNNVGIVKAGFGGLPEAGAPFFAVADLANYGPAPESVDVELVFDGRHWSRKLNLAGNARETVSIELNEIPAGRRQGCFRISQTSAVPDALGDDDRFPLCVNVLPARTIALLTSERSSETGSPAHFLERGMSASPEATVQVTRYVPAQFEGELDDALSRSCMLAIVNCGQLSDAQASGIARLIQSGMPVLYVTQFNADAENLKTLQSALGPALRLPVDFNPYKLGAANGGSLTKLLGFSSGERGDSGGRFLIGVNTDRRPFKVFGDAVTRFTETLRLDGGLSSSPREEPGLDPDAVLAKYSDGSAALVSIPVAAGRLAILNMAVGGENRHLGRHPVFVPLLQELCVELLESGLGRDTQTVLSGESITVPIPRTQKTPTKASGERKETVVSALPVKADAVAAEWQIRRLDGTLLDLTGADAPVFRADVNGNAMHWEASGEPDSYLIEHQGQPVAGFVVAPPVQEESDLAVLDPGVLKSRLEQERVLTVVNPLESADAAAGRENYDLFFLGSLAFLFAELLLLKAFKT